MQVLRTMTAPEYADWLSVVVPSYASDKVAGARSLYSKLGYAPTNINLYKPLRGHADRDA